MPDKGDGAQGSPIPYFEKVTGVAPYPWQVHLYQRLLSGEIPGEVAVPTGSGKTATLLLYLIALAEGAPLPRRLAYVVDRRAIVDQTTENVEAWIAGVREVSEFSRKLNALAAFPDPSRPVAVGTLRGGMADSGEWRLDPSCPTIVVGTVDMIGSRLLFSGYGDGRNRRSLHAGLLGMDCCLILDEAHLSTPFANTLSQICVLSEPCGGSRFAALTMTATPRTASGTALTKADYSHPELSRRLTASKPVGLIRTEDAKARRQALVDQALNHDSGTVLVYVGSAQLAQQIHEDLTRHISKEDADRVALFTGTIRGAERARTTESVLWHRFTDPDAEPDPRGPVFLIATAAGEVGVDLDAVHTVMDLAPADALIQRLGRVNRSGRYTQTTVTIVYSPKDVEYDPNKSDARTKRAVARERTLDWLLEQTDLAPALVLEWPAEDRLAASTPDPAFAPLLADRVELLAATGARIDKPAVEPLLRGLEEEADAGETQLLWRADVATLVAAGEQACTEAMAMLRPRPRELANLPSPEAARFLTELARGQGAFSLIRIGRGGATDTLVVEADTSRGRLAPQIRYATLVLPAQVGGLSDAGYPEPKRAGVAVEDLADDDEGCRYTETEAGPDETVPEWAQHAVRWRLPLFDLDDETSPRSWWVYARRRVGALALDADSDVSRLGGTDQRLAGHNEAVGTGLARLAEALSLPDWMAAALTEAGKRHDLGKDRRRWQRAAGNRGDEPVAKTVRGTFEPALLAGYRHEFGSLAEANRQLSNDAAALAPETRELALHLIAAHHGYARPGFADPRQWDPNLPSDLGESLARETETRYAALQDELGPWGLAWLEALVKCADARASAGLAVGD